MKILLFTHKSDIDGIGNIILAKLAFEEVDYALCEANNLTEMVNIYLVNEKIYQYDQIFITDLWLEDEILTKLANDEKLKGKIQVFDHHREVLKNNYDFVTLKVNNENGVCCATQLFYDYLRNKNLLNAQNNIQELVELTRRYDTWEWKTRYNDCKANELNTLFKVLGIEGYITSLVAKLKVPANLEFNDWEKQLIKQKIMQNAEQVKESTTRIIYRNVLGLKAGIVFINDEIKNDLAEYLREQNYDMDFLMAISMEKESISFRNVKDGVIVREIAQHFGGNGHDYAARAKINYLKRQRLIEEILKEK